MGELQLIEGLRQGDATSFSLLFKTYYKDLVLFAGTFLSEQTICEDIVQSVFLKLWNDRSNLIIETSLKSYLLRSVRNGCLDEIRHRAVIYEHESYTSGIGLLEDQDTENYILYSDLKKHLLQAMEKLPDNYRTAFEMNRFGGLKYKEIAARLSVSERTVEVRISKALELLREYLKDFLLAALLFFIK